VKPLRHVLFVFISALTSLPLRAQAVSPYAGEDSLLEARWMWAMREANRPDAKEFWVGYSIKRLMNDDSYIVSGRIISGPDGTRKSLYSILSIEKPAYGESRAHGERDAGIIKRMKEIALLFEFDLNRPAESRIRNVRLCTMDLSIDLKNEPVFWLGSSDEDQSVGHLKKLFNKEPSERVRKSLVGAIGIHQTSAMVYPLLT
jgi:hypothetical protein